MHLLIARVTHVALLLFGIVVGLRKYGFICTSTHSFIEHKKQCS